MGNTPSQEEIQPMKAGRVPAGKTRLCVAGFKVSHNTGHARCMADMIAKKFPDRYETWFHFPAFSPAEYFDYIETVIKPQLNEEQRASFSSRVGWSSPFCWLLNSDGVLDAKGGNDRFCEWVTAAFPEDEELKKYAATPPSLLSDMLFDKTPGTSQQAFSALLNGTMGNPEISYQKIRGLGAPLRMMCYYKSQNHINVSYGADMKEEWFAKDKPVLKKINSCINLPYITNGSEVVTQSNTCLLYLGQKLAIDLPASALMNHTVLDQTMDLRNDLMKIVYPFAGLVKTKEEFPDGARKHIEETARTHFGKLEGFCKGPYMCGAQPQSGDFALFEMIDQHISIQKEVGATPLLGPEIENCPKLCALHAAMKALPSLAKYFASPSYTEYSQNNPLYTTFTGKGKDFEWGGTVREQITF